MTPASDAEIAELARAAGKVPLPWGETTSHWLTRAAVERALGLLYAVAFLILVEQGDGLIGQHGILPADRYLRTLHERLGALAYVESPTLLWFGASDGVLKALAWTGVGLSVLVLSGRANAVVFGALWILYLSFVHVGQIFYGYGWELLLLEAGFLAIFLAPPLELRALSRSPPPTNVVWLYRWLVFRLMLGAGLIKIRGDACWRELTCLATHYETQPNPGPLSWYFHALPMWADKAGVLFNHLVELGAPFGVLGPRRVRNVSAVLVVVFQTTLILSGNLAFLNWLTIAVALACFDDAVYLRLLPRRLAGQLRERVRLAAEAAVTTPGRRRAIFGVTLLVAVLSLAPTFNLLLPEQRMNASFDPLHLVNTYGAFGSVDDERHEVVVEGTTSDVLAGDADWHEYSFRCKPGDTKRRPCLVTPYHYRLDWQMWFLGHRDTARDAWFFKFVYELLHGNPHVTALLADDPFRGSRPRYVRALLYRYTFAADLRQGYWNREILGEYLRPLSADDAALASFVRSRGWGGVEEP